MPRMVFAIQTGMSGGITALMADRRSGDQFVGDLELFGLDGIRHGASIGVDAGAGRQVTSGAAAEWIDRGADQVRPPAGDCG